MSTRALDEPFTPKIVHTLLEETLKGSKRRPGILSEQVETLTRRLNELKGNAEYRSTTLRKETETVHRMRVAIESLIEDLPTIREEYVGTLEGAERHSLDATNKDVRLRLLDAVPKAKANLDALDALMTAAQAVKELGLPLYPHTLLGPQLEWWPGGRRVDNWAGVARALMKMFKLATSGDEAGYRFVHAMIPEFTGKNPTLDAVRTELKRKRDKSWGKPEV